MHRIGVFVLLFICIPLVKTFAQQPVFISGTDGYKTYRIPAIVRAPNGDLLAFAEGRVDGDRDFGNIDIVMKRSRNNGKSWSKMQIVAVNGEFQAGNPAPVVDKTDPAFPKGRLFLFYNTGTNHEGEVRKGNGIREVWFTTSLDAGISWSEPTNITTSVHRPKQSKINADYDFPDDWRSYACAPGHALQLSSGPQKGRIYVPANHSSGDPKAQFTDYNAHGFYSDDHGKTFHLSEDIKIAGSNESTAAEISGGRLMMNSRNQRGDVKARIVAVSSDGGAKWDTVYYDKNLPDPVNEGSILTIGKNKNLNILAFTNAANTTQRDNLTLRISYNDGISWEDKILIDQSGKGEKDYTAYSDIVSLSDASIGVLYELNGYRSIVFKEIKWKKLTGYGKK